MKFNKWTLGLAAVGAVSLASAARADEQMSQVQTALSNTTISGYVDVAASWRPGTDQNGSTTFANIPRYSYAQNDGFSLNSVDIAIDKPMDESPWAAGYHVELMFGAQSPQGYYGIANGLGFVRQAYLSLRTPVGNSGIDWKAGVFDTIIGYESSSDPLNPNYTRSYGYTIEPTTHTGILGTYKVNDMFSVTAGVVNSWNEGIGLTPADLVVGNVSPTINESQKTYLGSIAFTAPDSWGWAKGGTITGGIINAVDSNFNGIGSQSSYYLGATFPTPVSALKVGAAFDWHDFHTAGTDPSIWVLGLYASYQINDKASLNIRGEYLDESGFAGPYGTKAEELTATLQYNLWANVLSRVEFRWDRAQTGKPFGASNVTPFGFRDNDFLLALNLIYQF